MRILKLCTQPWRALNKYETINVLEELLLPKSKDGEMPFALRTMARLRLWLCREKGTLSKAKEMISLGFGRSLAGSEGQDVREMRRAFWTLDSRELRKY